MGYLMKEALKALCGVNQWSYAVFWKIGCQNPKLLIWEECYYEAYSSSNSAIRNTMENQGMTMQALEGYQHGTQLEDKVQFLVDKMMMSNQVNVVGEGLVGRAAFTGNHQWIVSGNYNEFSYPAEVLHEVNLQISAGVKTIAVIPIMSHGVVQFGSPLAIPENVGFVHDVRSLITQLVCVPNAFISDNYLTKDDCMSGLPAVAGNINNQMNSSGSVINQSSNSLLTQFQDNLQVSGSSFMMNNLTHDSFKLLNPPKGSVGDRTTGGSLTPLKHDSAMNPLTNNPGSRITCQESSSSYNQSGPSLNNILEACNNGNQMFPSNNFMSDDDSFFKTAAGDDLFDVLGIDLKSKLLNNNADQLATGFGVTLESQTKGLSTSVNFQNFASGIYRDYGVSESGVFSSGSDHLLDAVISGVNSSTRQTSDDSMSCRTTASKISTSSVPSTPVGMFSMGDSMQQQFFGPSKSVSGLLGRSVGPVFGKSEGGICSTTSSAYGSQVSSWNEHGPATTSVSTANSKKADNEGGKARKRLKPGESPRPRPKDRQMIQDRVKELREIVPNGAKCSIDSLLERTIKHMLFLQSVSTHADKLKQTESKVNNRKEAGMFLRDNFEGGATWAFELGSQSMVCPIVVEDLTPPRQLLVEMLCEERGFFLEIADIIRGLGLTILKGVMEARNDKIWCRFAVEADRDITRMEVFISLVHLLEQTLSNNPVPASGSTDDNVLYPGPIPTQQQ